MNRKGSAIVESVIVFPVMVLTVTALICMMSYFYVQLSDRVDMHIMLRAESGRLCSNMYYKDTVERGFMIYKEAQQIYSSHVAVSEKHRVLPVREKEIGARKYLIDETGIVRMNSAVKDITGGNAE